MPNGSECRFLPLHSAALLINNVPTLHTEKEGQPTKSELCRKGRKENEEAVKKSCLGGIDFPGGCTGSKNARLALANLAQ